MDALDICFWNARYCHMSLHEPLLPACRQHPQNPDNAQPQAMAVEKILSSWIAWDAVARKLRLSVPPSAPGGQHLMGMPVSCMLPMLSTLSTQASMCGLGSIPAHVIQEPPAAHAPRHRQPGQVSQADRTRLQSRICEASRKIAGTGYLYKTGLDAVCPDKGFACRY